MISAEEKRITLTLIAQQQEMTVNPVNNFRGPKGEKGDPGTLTGIAEDSLKLGGVEAKAYLTADAAAETYLMKTAQAADSALLAGRPAEHYYQPRSILDNSDFTNPINQRGVTSVTPTARTYTIDRWFAPGTSTQYVFDNGIVTNTGYLWQKCDKAEYGNVYTAAIEFDAETIITTAQFAQNTAWKVFSTGTGTNGAVQLATDADGYLYFGLMTGNGVTNPVRRAALYEGTYTLVSLPPYTPKPHEVEMMACAAYYQRYTANQNWAWYFAGATMDTQNVRVSLPLTYPMRSNPTVTVEAPAGITIFTPSGLAAAKTVKGTTLYAGTNMLLLYLETNVALTSGNPVTMRLNSNIELSADL